MSQGAPHEDVGEGDHFVLYWDERRQWLIRAAKGKEFHTHKGIVKIEDVIGRSYGSRLESSLGAYFWVLRPSTHDYVMHLTRPTQIMYPKDIGLVLLKLGLCSGRVVVEAGTGSGAMTIAAANAVRPAGHVFSYEMRADFAEIAQRNLKRAGLADYVTIRTSDARTGFHEKSVDAVIIDLAEPWEVIPHAYAALKGGAPLASFTPTMNQTERTVTNLKMSHFVNIQTVECLVRSIRAEEGKTRPSTTMIAHTGYLTFANKVLPQHETPP